MSDDELRAALDEARAAAENLEHMMDHSRQFRARLAALNPGNNDDNAGLVGDGGMEEPAEADVEMGLDNEHPALDNGMEELAGADIEMGPDDGNLAPGGLRRNPPVTIMDWPDPDSDHASDISNSDSDDGTAIGSDYDPQFVERDEPLDFDPINEPAFTHEEIRQFLRERLGDLAKGEWIDLYTRNLTQIDRNTLSMLASRLRTHFSRQTWDDLRQGVCKDLDIPSEFVAWRRLRILAGKYARLEQCPFCKEPQYNARGKARRVFQYTPLIPQLQGLFQSRDMAAKLRYRAQAEQEYDPDIIQDVFDGENYRKLRETQLRPDDDYRIFDNPEDVALGFSTDGFTLFKRRRRGLSTAWPLILINYNLPPKIRTRHENVLCVSIVPGPKQCKDLNSFLIPLLDELTKLQAGVQSTRLSPEGICYRFLPRAFILNGFGDIPAVAKMLAIKAHNALTPCRACYIQGILYHFRRTSVYYLPLTNPITRRAFAAEHLPMRTHALCLANLAELDRLGAVATKAARDDYSRKCGLIGRSIFTYLKSIDLSSSFPYDIMHLLFENLVPNMIRHWIGEFKGLDQGNGAYQMTGMEWEEVGRLTAQATKTIPAAFVGTLPNIADDRNLYKAEAYAFWIQYIAPILLADHLPEPYYDHLILTREIVLRCLQLDITRAEIDDLEDMVVRWVNEYKEYYYQYEEDRLPTCPLTIHAMLHLPYYIRKTGPLWVTWAFVMERFCGHLLPAVKNRIRPYEHLNNYVSRRAQMQIVARIYEAPSLVRLQTKYRYEHGVELSSREHIYEDFPDIVLGAPVTKNVALTTQLLNRFTRYFGPFNRHLSPRELKERIDPDSIVRYGRFRMIRGDRMRTAKVIDNDPIARDNSYIKYDLVPDANTVQRYGPDIPYRETQYGRLLDVYHVMFINNDGSRTRYLLACVLPCNTGGGDAALPETPRVTFDSTLMLRSSPYLINIQTIVAAVGRIQVGRNEWAIIDRSRGCARTQFVDEEGEVEFD